MRHSFLLILFLSVFRCVFLYGLSISVRVLFVRLTYSLTITSWVMSLRVCFRMCVFISQRAVCHTLTLTFSRAPPQIFTLLLTGTHTYINPVEGKKSQGRRGSSISVQLQRIHSTQTQTFLVVTQADGSLILNLCDYLECKKNWLNGYQVCVCVWKRSRARDGRRNNNEKGENVTGL